MGGLYFAFIGDDGQVVDQTTVAHPDHGPNNRPQPDPAGGSRASRPRRLLRRCRRRPLDSSRRHLPHLRPSVTGLTGWLTLKWEGCEKSKVALATLARPPDRSIRTDPGGWSMGASSPIPDDLCWVEAAAVRAPR